MSRLYLYSVFHTNLAFSSIPEDHYPQVVERCYWPLLELVERFGFKIGLEFPAHTLEILSELEPSFAERVVELCGRGLVEAIGSSYSQSIMPINPWSANRDNLKLGNAAYKKILGRIPRIAYLNEQAFSRGIVDLYLDHGYRALVLDWNNAAKYNRLDPALQYGPQRIKGDSGRAIDVLWNNSVSFQKFQRYLHGWFPLKDYMSYLRTQRSKNGDRAFPMYGSDLEIFNYRPGGLDADQTGDLSREFPRLARLMEALLADPAFEVVHPGEVLERFESRTEVEASSSQVPIPCKKQDKYNVTRWAVSGRDDARINAQCHQLFSSIESLDALAEATGSRRGIALRELRQDLAYLFSSDFRTNTTDDKYLDFRNRMGEAVFKTKGRAEKLRKRLPPGMLLFNPHRTPWNGSPFSFRAAFKPDEIRSWPRVLLDGEPLTTQVEEVSRHRDGSVKSAGLVICPRMDALATARIEFAPVRSKKKTATGSQSGKLVTPAVEAKFLPGKGCSLASLRFPEVDPNPLVGLIPHGFFEDISLSYDLFCSHVVIVNREGRQITDLSGADLLPVEESPDPPIRRTVRARVRTEAGEVLKTFHAYADQPRLDVEYTFNFRDLRPVSFRIGALNAIPGAFRAESLRYGTVNGGRAPEWYPLTGQRVAQDSPVSALVSASACAGGTEGWLAFADGEKGIAVVTDKTRIFSVFLVHYEEADPSFFFRAYATIGESDETCKVLWRGLNRYTISYVGFRGDEVRPVRDAARSINRPLLILK